VRVYVTVSLVGLEKLMIEFSGFAHLLENPGKFLIYFYCASSYASAVLGDVIPSVCLSVHLSVTHMVCDKTKQCTADILIPH